MSSKENGRKCLTLLKTENSFKNPKYFTIKKYGLKFGDLGPEKILKCNFFLNSCFTFFSHRFLGNLASL